MGAVIRHLCQAVLQQNARTDGQLLASFIDNRDEAAFAALVHRHGPMVFGVCRRVVGNHHDADDAFQATFLVLARKATSVRPRDKVANWLHGVALRTAMKAKSMSAKRRGREKQVTEMPEPEAAPQGQWRDLQPLLDQELNGLPENYRLPILLCDLEGKSIKDAAQQLGWPQGSLAGRLARGRKLLAKRLANRGVVLSAGSLAAVVSQNVASAAVPPTLMRSTVQATITGVVADRVALLTEGVLKSMLLSKLKTAMMGLLLVALLIGAAGAIYQTRAAEEQTTKTTVVPSPSPDKAGPKNDLEGVWAVVSVKDTEKKTLDFDPIFSHAAGTQAPIRNARLTLQGGNFILKTGPVSLAGTYTFDPSVTPKVISLNITESGRLLSIPGEYSLDANKLTITFGKVPASQVAGLAGKEAGVCYTLRRETLQNRATSQIVPAPPKTNVRLVAKVYPIVSLIDDAVPEGKEAEPLMKLIRKVIEPTSWSEMGGDGSIEYLPRAGSFVIRQTPDLHQQVQELLDGLRKARTDQAEEGPAPPAKRQQVIGR
jgi:RNA polymerase sigma factor (sigma-70 family)